MIGFRRHRAARCRCLTLPGVPEAAHEARALVLVLGELTEEQAWNASLVVSELVGNAIRHSKSGLPGGSLTVILEPSEEALHISVRDAGPLHGRRAPRELTEELRESGRGQLIVAAVSCARGVRAGHEFWADVAA